MSCWDEANKRGFNKASIYSTVKLIPPLKAAHLASKDAVKGFEQQRGRDWGCVRKNRGFECFA